MTGDKYRPRSACRAKRCWIIFSANAEAAVDCLLSRIRIHICKTMTSSRFAPATRAGVSNLLLPAALGALATLGFAPFGRYVVTWLAVAALVGLWWGANAKVGAVRGFAFGLGLFGTGMHWPFISLYQYGNVPL